MSTLSMTGAPEADYRERLDARLHEIGWGLLITLTGVIWLLPEQHVPQGAWLIGVGAILLGVNLVRYLNHIRVNVLSAMLGAIALLAATSQVWRTDLPLLPICLVVIGLSLVIRPLFGKTN